MDFKTRLKELRESRGLTQKQLADELNHYRIGDKDGNSTLISISTQTISYWENGREPSFSILIKLAKFFDVPTDYLLGHTDKLDLNEINFENSLENFNIDKVNAVTSLLTRELKSAFFNIVHSHLDTLGISDELYFGTPLTDSKLDYMYLISKLDKLISNFDNSLINIFTLLHDDDDSNITILKELNKSRISSLTELITSTTSQFSLILNEFIQMRIGELNNNDYKSKYIEELKNMK